MDILRGQTGRIPIEDAPDDLDRPALLRAVAARLEAAGAVDVLVEKGELTFRAGPFRAPGRALTAISTGEVAVDRDLLTLTYRITFSGLLAAVTVATGLLAALAAWGGQLRLAAAAALLWPALVGLGAITASARFDRLLREALESAGCTLGR